MVDGASVPTSPDLDPELLRLLRATDTPTLANAIERLRVRDRSTGYIGGTVRCVRDLAAPMVGRALTVTMTSSAGPVASRDGYWRMWEALEAVPGPSVLVVGDVSGTPGRCAYLGEVMASIAIALGGVGIVTDGGVRDVAELADLGFAAFASYVVPSHGNFEVISVGEPVEIGGEPIRPGDLLHGDVNGVIVVPAVDAAELQGEVQRIRDQEARQLARIRTHGFRVADIRDGAGY